MPRYIAFLRAINVGGHAVKMDRLRSLFEEIGLSGVATFIASGNVIFDSPAESSRELEEQIEAHLKTALGYEVATFIRSAAELATVATHQPFPAEDIEAEAASVFVAFLRHAPSEAERQTVLALRSEEADFHLNGGEIFWLCRIRLSDSRVFKGGLFEKAIKAPLTMRNMSTVRKLAEKYGVAPSKGSA